MVLHITWLGWIKQTTHLGISCQCYYPSSSICKNSFCFVQLSAHIKENLLTPQGYVILVILFVIIYSPIVQLCLLVTASVKHACHIELEDQPRCSSIASLYLLYNYVAHKITIWYAECLYLCALGQVSSTHNTWSYYDAFFTDEEICVCEVICLLLQETDPALN